MNILNINNIINVVPVAVILSVVFFLVKFFGKAYSDQVPFADDRSWHEELFGISFFSSQVLSPAISVLLLFSKGWKFWQFLKEDWLLLGISTLVFVSSIIISNKSKKFFNDDNFYEGNYFLSLKKMSDSDNKKIDDSDKTALLRTLFFPLITILIMLGTLSLYRWGAYYHLIGAIIVLFFYLTTLALMFSLMKRHILKANIHFINAREEIIKKCRVIKVNNDNVKVKTEDGQFVIINKACILKIEFIKDHSMDDHKEKISEKTNEQL
jgi:hypothetical protein